MTAPAAGSPAQARTALDWAVRNLVPSLGALGILLYGIFRLAYVFFYLQLRTTPEEVGYGYSQVLSESIAGAVELVVIFAILFSLPALLGYVTVLAVRRFRPPAGTTASGPLPVSLTRIRKILLWSLAAAVTLVPLSLPALAWWQGGLARSGQTIRNVYFVGLPYLPVLAVQAVPAQVSWVDDSSNKTFDLTQRNCLMYVGAADGTSIFYDASSHESVRLPSGGISVTLRYTFFVPAGC